MLGKVLKYDFKRLGRQILPIYIITLIMSFVNWGFQILAESNVIFSVISSFVTMLFVILLLATIIGTFALCIRYFYVNLLTDEGYLTNTLPVSKNTLISSKVVTSMVYGIMSIIVAIIATGIGFIQYVDLIDLIQKVYNSGIMDTLMGMKAPGSVILFVVVMSLSYLMQLLFFFFALALGQRQSGNRILYSFVYGIVLYCVQQVVSFVMLGILLLTNPDITNIFNSNNLPIDSVLQSLYIMTLISTIIIITAYWYGTTRTLDKKLNLE